MANVDAPHGFKPVRYKDGSPYNGATNPYYVAVTYGTALFVGDPIVKTGTANTAEVEFPGAGKFEIATLPEIALAAAGDGTRMTGVIVSFSALPDDLTKVHNPASTERIANVCDDPNVVFEIQADGAIPATSIGLNANWIATHAGSTVTGLSGEELDTGTSDAPDADASNQLVILRQVNRVDNEPNLIHNEIEVFINQHTEIAGTVGTLGI